ncbi:MAG: TetR/AcrR family transcriptional regulator [Acidimicrobiales bacterium]|jgi:AcrR family transcriptional regulator
MESSSAEAFSLVMFPVDQHGIPTPPAEELDPFLDAAARCFARYGVRRTSVQDVANELGVNRATVYRQVGTIDQQIRLLIARDLHRLVAELPASLAGKSGPRAVVELMATIIGFASEHPVLTKVLQDEPELIGPFLVSDLPEVITRVTAAIAPLLDAAMAANQIATRDPGLLAESLVRLGITLILAPPPGDLDAFLAEVLVPTLKPSPKR